MGVKGLLKALNPYAKQVNLRDYRGQRAAVDILCWMHRGSYSCSHELAEGIESTKYIKFCLNMLEILVANGVIPLVVFDGCELPGKVNTNSVRRQTRFQNLIQARLANDAGYTKAATKHYQQAVSITPDMIEALKVALRRHEIEYFVAPYESDPQMAFLSNCSHVDFVITEDSDLVVYGSRRILYKLDTSGNATEIIPHIIFLPPTDNFYCNSDKEYDFAHWNPDQFIMFCCLCGCDYTTTKNKIRNLGMKTAFRIVSKAKSLKTLIIDLVYTYGDKVTEHFVDEIHKAWLIYKHQTVYNPATEQLQHLTRIPAHYSLDILHNTAARQEATGNLFDFLGPMQISSGNPSIEHASPPMPNRSSDKEIGKNIAKATTDNLWHFVVNKTASQRTVPDSISPIRKPKASRVSAHTPFQSTFINAHSFETISHRQQRLKHQSTLYPTNCKMTSNLASLHSTNAISNSENPFFMDITASTKSYSPLFLSATGPEDAPMEQYHWNSTHTDHQETLDKSFGQANSQYRHLSQSLPQDNFVDPSAVPWSFEDKIDPMFRNLLKYT